MVVGEIDVWKDIKYFHFISIILQGFWGWNPKYKGGNVMGVGWVCDFGWTRQLGYGLIRELSLFEFWILVVLIMMMWLGIVQKVRSLENKERTWDTKFWTRIGRAIGTCRKPQIMFWYNTNFKCCFGFFFNKTWDYDVIWIHVFSNIKKHKLLQWICCSSSVWTFCSIKLWWNEL
jgi:hypothetical protein